jgi:hypothetical protein
MINEIINVYSKQLGLYITIKEMLENVQKKDFDIISYNLEFENADFILNQIEKLNEKAEQLKLIYVSKNHLSDFSGEEIKRIESPDNYNKIKETIESITKMIASVKQTQDSVINKINTESNINKKIQSNCEKKSAMNIYKSNVEKNK